MVYKCSKSAVHALFTDREVDLISCSNFSDSLPLPGLQSLRIGVLI